MKAWNEKKKVTTGPRINIEKRKDFKKLPVKANKILIEANKMIEEYLVVYKKHFPRPLYAKERTKLMNYCRTTSLCAKKLSGFLSYIKQNTEIDYKLIGEN